MEQDQYLQSLLKQAKDFDKKLGEQQQTTQDDVVIAMKKNWQTAREQEALVIGKQLLIVCDILNYFYLY